jgi:putative oxidoreductase
VKDLWLKVISKLHDGQSFVQLGVRISVGVMFAGGAIKNKLRSLEQFTAFFEALGIPLASIQAPMVALVELSCGLLLVIGLGTRLAAAALAGTMVVAIGTAAMTAKYGSLRPSVADQFDKSFFDGVLQFLYMPEFLLLAMLVWLVFAGPGRLSIDHGIARQHGVAR